VGTSVDGEWAFSQAAINSRPDYEALNKEIIDTLLDEFAGPADKGVYRCVSAPTNGPVGVVWLVGGT
jgi:hypothetical protein